MKRLVNTLPLCSPSLDRTARRAATGNQQAPPMICSINLWVTWETVGVDNGEAPRIPTHRLSRRLRLPCAQGAHRLLNWTVTLQMQKSTVAFALPIQVQIWTVMVSGKGQVAKWRFQPYCAADQIRSQVGFVAVVVGIMNPIVD